jgi:hypothetical protein
MRTVLLGTDLVYNSLGNLKPIEINTNAGMSRMTQTEIDNALNLNELSNFITSNNFTKVTYIGGIIQFEKKLQELCVTLNIEYVFSEVANNITIPFVEDSETHLIIRSAYDVTAIVDETYCKDKVNFLKLIQSTEFGCQFAYMDESNQLVSNITTFNDNGVHPNFVLKAKYPVYDRNEYPKFFKVATQEQLDVVLQNVTNEYFLMEYYFNAEKIENNTVTVVRSYNLLYPPTLESIAIGAYTKHGNVQLFEDVTYDTETFEVNSNFRKSYISGTQTINKPKLMDDDLVMMADGSYKTGLELQVGDVVKTIKLYENQPNLTESDELRGYSVNFTEFLSNSTFSTNVVLGKQKSNVLSPMTTITFDDNTTWEDTSISQYLIKRGDIVKWTALNLEDTTLDMLQIGDKILLVQTDDLETVSVVEKTVTNITNSVNGFDGWTITVQDEHLFLTKTNDGMFVAIEHNYQCQPCNTFGIGAGGCDKMYEYCTTNGGGPCFASGLVCLPL